MDMLPFTDDIHKRSPSFTTICLKSDSTLVRSIAQFVIVGRCRTAGWNCFRMATVVRLSVELVMASVLRRTSPTERAAAVRSTRSLGSDMFTASRSACVFNGFISARLHIAYMLSALYAIARLSVCLSVCHSVSDAFISPYGESMACRQRRRVSCSRHCSAMVRKVPEWYE